jgi:phosphohistidine phosphatase
VKRLVLIRHAKSSWANPLQSDFDRPLNDRGQRDAPAMGARLKKAGVVPDRIISSTARRAAQTAKLIAAAVDYDDAGIQWNEELYHCVPAVFEEVIETVDDSVNTLFIFAHNPGISELAAQLDGGRRITHMPTCAVAGFALEAESWSDFSRSNKKTILFDTPKKDHE